MKFRKYILILIVEGYPLATYIIRFADEIQKIYILILIVEGYPMATYIIRFADEIQKIYTNSDSRNVKHAEKWMMRDLKDFC